jgi:undecaprenyl diphosphate synthase
LNPHSLENKKNTAARLDIHPDQMPRHIAIIMDGNGRWATSRGLPRFEGHRQGGKTVEQIVLGCVDYGIEALTLYSFSMQNWKRPQAEIDFLMYLYTRYLIEIRPTLMKNNVQLVHLGREEGLPDLVVQEMHETMRITSNNDGLKLGLALNYGSRTEIMDAVRKIADQVKDGKLDIDDIDEKCISQNLYTNTLPDPDLLVRTSGEMRVSNFLLWQISYCEFFVTETHWPDFDRSNLDEAILNFAKRQRRFGDIKEKAKK